MPPSRYLGLWWAQEWGETDYLLTQALDIHDRLHCPECGCWMPESHDDQAADSFAVEVAATCHGCVALDQHRRESEPVAGEKLRLSIPASVKARWRRVASAVADRLADQRV